MTTAEWEDGEIHYGDIDYDRESGVNIEDEPWYPAYIERQKQEYGNDKIHNEVFCPPKKTAENYNEIISNFYGKVFKPGFAKDKSFNLNYFDKEASKLKTIDMGELPGIYRELGIRDKRLKTNGKAIFKHNIPAEIIRNLISLAYDPQAVFKSLSTSTNPNGYIAVLDAKTAKDEWIIAVLSPSKDGKGFTFMPTVYEKRNFDLFLERTLNEQKILYIKNESSEAWGQLQSLPRHKSEPSIKNILTKKDIVNRILGKKKELEKYFSEIKIGHIGDFKKEFTFLMKKYPEEFNNDSVKCANTLLSIVSDDIRKDFQVDLRLHGCHNADETRKVLDGWASGEFMENQFNWVDIKKIKPAVKEFEGDFLDSALGIIIVTPPPPNNDNKAGIFLYRNKMALDACNPKFFTWVDADINTAKKLAEKTVSHFNENENVGKDDIEKYINSEYDADQARKGFKRLSSILETGESKTIQNEKIGNVSLDKGHTGKDGYGLLHIIERRNEKNKLDEEKITALLYKVTDSVKSGHITDSINIRKKNNDKRIGIENDGIIAIVSRREGTHEKFVLTGYEINKKKEEAAEAIRTVIARYGHTPEFSDFRKQVGAVVSSLNIVSPQLNNKSRKIETAGRDKKMKQNEGMGR